ASSVLIGRPNATRRSSGAVPDSATSDCTVISLSTIQSPYARLEPFSCVAKELCGDTLHFRRCCLPPVHRVEALLVLGRILQIGAPQDVGRLRVGVIHFNFGSEAV